MARVTIDERCSCGATFRIVMESTYAGSDSRTAAAAWRSEHRHERPARTRIPMTPRSAR